MNKKALLVLSIGLLSMTLAACGNKPINSSIEQSSIDYGPSQTCSGMTTPPSSEQAPATSEQVPVSSVEPVSSEPQRSSEPAPSSVPVSSSETLPSSSTTPISSSEEPISSSEAPSSSEEQPYHNAVVNLTSYSDATKTYQLSFTYSNFLFDYDPAYFNRDIAMFAYGMAIANQNKNSMTQFYSDCGFSHIFLSESYDQTPTEASIGYAFAILNDGYRNFVFVSIRGFNYGREWADNFNVGLEGEHNGFAARANEIKTALEAYVAEYALANVELFITGYSRGGAVANLLAKKMDDIIYLGSEVYDCLYAYTFEAPRGGLSGEIKNDYKNIFNIVSDGDLVTHILPNEYGFIRYGQDVDIYSSNIDSIIAEFDPEMQFPPLVATDSYATDPELVNFLINGIVSYEQDTSDPEAAKQAQTREEFVTNYQPALAYGIGLFFSLKSETVANIKEGFNNLSMWDKILLFAQDGIYNFVNPYLQEDGVSYDQDELRTACNTVLEFIKGPGQMALAVMLDENNPLSRMILLHTPEINYALLSALPEDTK